MPGKSSNSPRVVRRYEDGSASLSDGRVLDAETGRVRKKIPYVVGAESAPVRRGRARSAGVRKRGGTL